MYPGGKGKRCSRRWMMGLLTGLMAAVAFTSSRHAQRLGACFEPVQSQSPKSPIRERSTHEIIKDPPILKTVDSWNGQGQPFGRCGDGQNHTSLYHTAARFFAATYSFESSGIQANPNTNPFIKLTLTFQALDVNGKVRTNGGDEFVMTLLYWTRSETKTNVAAFKQSAVAIDLGIGVYEVSFTIPRHGIEQFQLSLLHYYSCYQGLGPHKPGEAFFNISFGPHDLVHPSLEQFFLENQTIPHKNTADSGVNAVSLDPTPLEYFDSPHQPYCEFSQQG